MFVKEDFKIFRSENQIMVCDSTCKKLIITDESLLNKTDEEIVEYCSRVLIKANNDRERRV